MSLMHVDMRGFRRLGNKITVFTRPEGRGVEFSYIV